MDWLFDSLNQRKRPEDVADHILRAFGDRLDRRQVKTLQRAAKGALRRRVWAFTSMSEAFAEPVGLSVQISKAQVVFDSAYSLTAEEASDPAKASAFVRHVGAEIRKAWGRSDFMHDRLNRDARKAAGLDISRRRYNRKFRMLARLEDKIATLAREWRKRTFTLIGKSGLASRIAREDFFRSETAACFVAYFTARSNLRSQFTIAGQARPFDEIARMLFERCERDPGCCWWTIAHVYPTADVLGRLTDDQKGRLMSAWYELLVDIGDLLREVFESAWFDRRTMIVRRGNDSTTWNNTASAWNTARGHWIALLHAMGTESLLDTLCPGKVMRLMAADVAMWHRSAGGGLDPDTAVWAELPMPWAVLSGEARCGRAAVETACRRHGVDPAARGWTAPKRRGRVERFRPTPELVHGVAVSSPRLAAVLKKAGWYSGKATGGVPKVAAPVYGHVLKAHRTAEERRRAAQEKEAQEAL